MPPHEALLDMLSRCAVVRLYFDADHERAHVPKHLKGITCFDLGLNLPKPIHDLRVTENGVSATLSFGGTPHWCLVRWPAVALFCDAKTGENVALQTDAYQKMAGAFALSPPASKHTSGATRPALRLIKGGAA